MKIHVESVEEFLQMVREKSRNTEMYIFGAGNYGNVFGKFLNQNKVDWNGYIDNKQELHFTVLNEKNIYSIDILDDKSDACVLISVSGILSQEIYDEIERQLLSKKIKEDNIMYFGDNYNVIDRMVYDIKQPQIYLNKLKTLKGKFIGKRCFIIGNGPSLTLEDLEKLSGEVTMGCNRILQLVDKTKLYPTCFFFEDSYFAKNNAKSREDIEKIVNSCDMAFTVINNDVYDKYRDEFETLYYMYTERNFEGYRFSEKIDEVIYASGTTLFSMFQVAFYMGIKEVYLLGVDSSFYREVDKNGNLVINENVDNHMKLMQQDKQGIYNMNLIMNAYQNVLRYSEEHAIKVYNATRGGKLEIFPRVDFDSLFKGV